MNLIEKTDLSQPSIRNMLRSLQKQNIIHEIGCDFSTGGRCPTRFALNTDKFHLLCIFIQNHIAHVHIIYNKQEQAHFHIDYQVEVDLIKSNTAHYSTIFYSLLCSFSRRNCTRSYLHHRSF